MTNDTLAKIADIVLEAMQHAHDYDLSDRFARRVPAHEAIPFTDRIFSLIETVPVGS